MGIGIKVNNDESYCTECAISKQLNNNETCYVKEEIRRLRGQQAIQRDLAALVANGQIDGCDSEEELKELHTELSAQLDEQ